MSGRWGIVEINGRQMHAGIVTDEVILGVQMCCVQQPEHVQKRTDYEYTETGRRTRIITERYPETRFELGASAIYRRTFVSETAARGALPRCSYGEQEIERIEGPWQEPAPRPALPGPVEEAEEVEDDGIPFDDDCDDEAPSPEEQARRFALAEQPCPRGPCTECAGADEYDHHWDDASRDIDDARQECRHCDAERPYPEDEDDYDDEEADRPQEDDGEPS